MKLFLKFALRFMSNFLSVRKCDFWLVFTFGMVWKLIRMRILPIHWPFHQLSHADMLLASVPREPPIFNLDSMQNSYQ